MFRYYMLVGDTAAPSGPYARLCPAFLVTSLFRCPSQNCFAMAKTQPWYCAGECFCFRMMCL